MLATLTNIGDFAKITQTQPLDYVTKILNWVDDIQGLGTVKKEFRWGVTNLVRASWIDLTVDNLQKIVLDPNNELFVDFRFTLISGGAVTINDAYIEYEQSDAAADKFLGYRPPMYVSENGNISNLSKITNFSFKPYQVNPAVVLYKELAYTINRMFGHDVMYARAVPMSIGRDVVLHEWTLYDVDEPCCVKVIVDKNEFPDNKIDYNPMGMDFELPFEVQIVKEYFEEIFGIGSAPQKRDIVYFPLTNRIYEVESSYLWKDIMQQNVYWKVSLIKYAPKSNRQEPQDLRQYLADISTDFTEEFEEEVIEQEIKTTKPQQYDPKIGSHDYDPIRLSINPDLNITQVPFKNYNITISESQYDLRSIFDNTKPVTAITYKSDAVFPADEDRMLSGWFQEIKPKVILPKDNIKGQLAKGPSNNGITPISFIISPKRNYKDGDLIKISRFNGLTVYGNYISTTPVSGGYVITIGVKDEIISFIDTYYPGWATSSIKNGYIAEPTFETIMMNGWDEISETGWKLSLYANRFFIFKSSEEELIFILPNNIIENYWYGFVFNVSNFYQQASLDVWIRTWDETNLNAPQTTNLENIYSKTIIIKAADRTASTGSIKYTLPASNMVYTNIRLFKQIETDLNKQIFMLNQAIVQDAQYAVIIDNAVQRLNLPWSGLTK